MHVFPWAAQFLTTGLREQTKSSLVCVWSPEWTGAIRTLVWIKQLSATLYIVANTILLTGPQSPLVVKDTSCESAVEKAVLIHGQAIWDELSLEERKHILVFS